MEFDYIVVGTGSAGSVVAARLSEIAGATVLVLEDDLGLPVWIENDGNAAAIGESLVGVGRWAKDFVYLYVAAGLGGGVILNGEIVRGQYGNAGEIAELLPPAVYPHPNLELLRKLVRKHGQDVDTVSELVEKFDINWPGVEEWIARTPAPGPIREDDDPAHMPE